MAERPTLMYVIVKDELDDDVGGGDGEQEQEQVQKLGNHNRFPPRYTRSILQSTLQLMGCKTRHALKISDRVFEVLRTEVLVGTGDRILRYRNPEEGESNEESEQDGQHCAAKLEKCGSAPISERVFDVGRSEAPAGNSGKISRRLGNSGEHETMDKSEQVEQHCTAKHGNCTRTPISDRVFDVGRTEAPVGNSDKISRRHGNSGGHETMDKSERNCTAELKNCSTLEHESKYGGEKRSTVTVTRDRFFDIICDTLAKYRYVGPNQRADLMLACRVREKKTSVTVLLSGTSGCGKSTLASLLASRLGITTVVSTDSLRHMMRGFLSEKENSLLWASTYHAGECLVPVAEGLARTEEKIVSNSIIPLQSTASSAGCSSSQQSIDESSEEPVNDTGVLRNGHAGENGNVTGQQVARNDGALAIDALVGSKKIVVQGFKAQSEMVIDSLDRLITAWEKKNESVVFEGVHLSLNFVMGLMKKHPSVVPFMIYIGNESKHLERFAVRARNMTLDPAKNRYVKYIRNIRTIQEYLCKRADKHLVPKVNNTNVDKSVALIHATSFSCLRRRVGGEPLYDQATNTVKVVDQEYRNQCAASSLGSKGMFQLIQRTGSSRSLMTLMNKEGLVVKAWPVVTELDGKGKAVLATSSNCKETGVGTLSTGKLQPVHLQFGNFGLGACGWLTDSSEASCSVRGSGECELSGSNSGSSSSSSPPSKDGEWGAKKITDEVVVSGSDDEPDEEDPPEVDSDAEASEHTQFEQDEEGSIGDLSERSDEDGEDPLHP